MEADYGKLYAGKDQTASHGKYPKDNRRDESTEGKPYNGLADDKQHIKGPK